MDDLWTDAPADTASSAVKAAATFDRPRSGWRTSAAQPGSDAESTPPSSRLTLRLANLLDWRGFSSALRSLRAQGVLPDRVDWCIAGDASREADLFDDGRHGPVVDVADLPPGPALRLPRDFVEGAREVFLHADPRRLPLLHRLFERVADDQRHLADTLHPDRLAFEQRRREVHREMHKMKAFVRFRQVTEADGGVRHVAWFEPAHAVAEAVAPFFARRFASMRWAILTPRVSIAWEPDMTRPGGAGGGGGEQAASDMRARDVGIGANEMSRMPDRPDDRPGSTAAPERPDTPTSIDDVRARYPGLRFGPGGPASEAPSADAGESLWLAYYRSIFNPARLNAQQMRKEMPVRFWKNLPEAVLIAPLMDAAPSREGRMVADGGVARRRRRSVALDDAPGFQPADAAAGPTGAGPYGTGDRRDAVGGASADAEGRSACDTRCGADDPGARVVVESRSPIALATLGRQAAGCRDCPIADRATQVVWGEGPPDASLMLVGEQPGDQEDLRGRPFVGPAGALLRETLASLGWDASALYLTNAVKHFHHEPRGKRRLHKTPGQREVDACRHWLEAEIDALRPKAIVALGATAARSLLGPGVSVTAHEGEWWWRADGVPVLVCGHPAAILRAEPERQAAMRARWRSFLARATTPPEPASP